MVRAPNLKSVGLGFKSCSDHYLMLFSVAPSSTSRLRLYRKFSRDTEEIILSELSEINWDLAMRNCGDNADAGFSKFFNSVNKIVNKLRPFDLYQSAKPSNFLNPGSLGGYVSQYR